ncbi:MAG: TetR family transcriptional regulator [Anaerolineae bacterium]
MKRTAEEAAKTRTDLLDAALVVFSQRGYSAARLQDIAAAAGVTRGAVYHHFQNKAGLFEALMEAASQQGNSIVSDAISAGGSFLDICEQILITSFEMVATNKKARDTMSIYLFKSDFSAELQSFAETLKQQAVLSVQGVAEFVKMGIAQGELKPDLDPEVVARSFIAFQNGVIQLWLLNQEAFDLKEGARDLARTFLYGIAR